MSANKSSTLSIKSSSLSILFLVLSLVLALIQSTQAVCMIYGTRFETCAFSLPDCSNITAEALEANYGLGGAQVAAYHPRSVEISIVGMDLVKIALAPYLQGCSKSEGGTAMVTIFSKGCTAA